MPLDTIAVRSRSRQILGGFLLFPCNWPAFDNKEGRRKVLCIESTLGNFLFTRPEDKCNEVAVSVECSITSLVITKRSILQAPRQDQGHVTTGSTMA